MIAAAAGSVAPAQAGPANLPAYTLFAGLLAMAGLPIYIHAPKFYVDEYGVGLGALTAALVALRMIDFVQDPALGWLANATRVRRGAAVACAVAIMAAAMVGLFAVVPPIAPLWWFALTLTALFSAFSFLTISFYAQGVRKAETLGPAGHVRLATWRETGALLGVCMAAAAPTGLMLVTDAPFAAFALGFVAVAGAALWAMRGEWRAAAAPAESGLASFAIVLRDRLARRLLLIALVNAMPVAVTSTLFLFFVESRLELPGWEGPFLLIFFLSAAAAAPVWGRLAASFGARRMLLSGMALAIVTFAFAATLGTGDGIAFAAICVASGAALGADLTLLAAIFARRMARIAPEAGAAFGLWAFVSKATLAIAAISLLALEGGGFQSGTENPESALILLTILYAIVPCALKLGAIALLALTPVEER